MCAYLENVIFLFKLVLWVPPGCCFVSKFWILSAISSTDVYEIIQELNQKEIFTGTTIICQYDVYILV